jgi:tRNA1(Val) A37 N6-methylase TrmN6
MSVRLTSDLASDLADVSEDAILGGRLVLRQPLRGHRFGHDAILLAAAVSACAGEHAVELGAGVGAAGLALAHRVGGLSVTLVEIDRALASLANGNAARNGMVGRVRALCLDAEAPADAFAAAGLPPGCAAHVLMNPPFNSGRHNASPDPGRRVAHVGSGETLSKWLATAARLLAADGVVTLIWRADGLADVLAALARDFGGVSILPVYPRPGAAAIRVLARGIKASAAPLTALPGLVLADGGNKPTQQAKAILRENAALLMTMY